MEAVLFAPPKPPVRLEPACEMVLGRGSECDLPLPSRQASRRHALIRGEGGRFFLRDLGSTNGTFLNGEAVRGEQELQPGDRIGLGDALVTFCRVDTAMVEATAGAGSDQTLLIQATPQAGGNALVGSFDEIPVYAVLQMLEMGAKSGELLVETASGPGSLFLEDGRPVHAETEKARGEEAAFAIVSCKSGRFEFRTVALPEERTLACSLTELLLEATRMADEGER